MLWPLHLRFCGTTVVNVFHNLSNSAGSVVYIEITVISPAVIIFRVFSSFPPVVIGIVC